MIKMPRLDGSRLARSFIIRTASRHVNNTLDKIGPEGTGWLIDHNSSLSDVACLVEYGGGKVPDVVIVFDRRMPQLKELSKRLEVDYRHQAATYSWAARAISDDDFRNMLPDWAQELISSEQGKVWWQEQVKWLRSLFGGK